MIFSIPATPHGFNALSNGSGFAANFGSAVTSNTMTVRVTATKLTFTQQPSPSVWTNVDMAQAAIVTAQDANGNTDEDWATDIVLGNS